MHAIAWIRDKLECSGRPFQSNIMFVVQPDPQAVTGLEMLTLYCIKNIRNLSP